ncbi:fatty-acid synthase system [Sarracenia purpurea var. burkii]
MDEKFETVISGISGRFPDCESIPEFKTKLYSGESFMSLVPERWPTDFRYQSSIGYWKFKFIEEFDPVVFQINNALATCTDVINRKIWEPAFECVMDSGRNVAVYMTYDHCDSDANSVACLGEGRLWILGSGKTMMSNRVSFALNLTGPSFTYANDMFGNLTALDAAYKNVSEGHVEAAIVGVATAVQNPMLSVNLFNMGLLSPDSVTRVFDTNANGYGKSDALVCLFIQRADDAKRIYASIDFTGYTYFGSNSNSYYNFDEDVLKNSFQHLLQQNNYNEFDDVSFVEMSACGLEKYDKIESNFIADTFYKDNRNPLLVGSVKSNVGMTDSAGPYVSVIKALLALESGIIVQNVDMNEVNTRIRAFVENKLRVVVKPTSLTSDKILVNSVGITGKGYNEIKGVLPETIEVACHNSDSSCTLSGPAEDVEKYVQELQHQKIFAKAVNVANIAYHSKHIAPAAPNLLARLKEVGSHSGDPITIHVNEDSPYYYLRDHQINDRIVLPTSFFLV